jgi:hypothetical protein
MLTDDDLTRELRAAFRGATADLNYTGRTRPPRAMSVVLPTVATAATLAAVAVGVGATGGHHPPAARSVVGPVVAPSAGTTTKLVTKTIKLAGFTLTYQSAAGAPSPLYWKVGFGKIPAEAREVHVTGTKARVWAGKDPSTGHNALYVKTPTRDGGTLFALYSPTWSEHQLIALFKHRVQGALGTTRS